MLRSLNNFYQGGTALCFLTIFSIGEQNDEIKTLMDQALKKWINSLALTLKELEIKNSKKQATFAISCLQGSLVLAHLKKEPKLFQSNLTLLAESWNL